VFFRTRDAQQPQHLVVDLVDLWKKSLVLGFMPTGEAGAVVFSQSALAVCVDKCAIAGQTDIVAQFHG
jgi:hypothetical protein